MNPFASFFKRGPDAIQLSDWLENMNESFVEWGFKILSGDKSSQDMLVCFTLINATGSAYNLLHATPSIASRIGVAYGELRAYFECLWYLYLLTKYESANDRNRISKLYGSVSLKLEQTLTALFSKNPNIKHCLQSASGEPYRKLFAASAKQYLQGNSSADESENALIENIQFLSLAVQRTTGLRERDRQVVVSVLSENTEKALQLKFLNRI